MEQPELVMKFLTVLGAPLSITILLKSIGVRGRFDSREHLHQGNYSRTSHGCNTFLKNVSTRWSSCLLIRWLLLGPLGVTYEPRVTVIFETILTITFLTQKHFKTATGTVSLQNQFKEGVTADAKMETVMVIESIHPKF